MVIGALIQQVRFFSWNWWSELQPFVVCLINVPPAFSAGLPPSAAGRRPGGGLVGLRR